MVSSGGEPVTEAVTALGRGPARASGGAAGSAAALFVLWTVLGSMPQEARVVAWVTSGLLVLLAVGTWRQWPGAIAFAVFVGAFAVFLGGMALVAAGDDVYEQVPQALNAVVPALALVLGAVVLVGAAATFPPAGRPGRWAAVLSLAVGLVLGAAGTWKLLEVQQPPGSFSQPVPACGSAYRPVSSSSGVGNCWEVLGPARDDGRLMLGLGLPAILLGIGGLVGQFGPRTWPIAAAIGGVVALGIGVWIGGMPLQSNACRSINERYTGPVCDGLRAAISVAAPALAIVGGLLVVAALVGLATSVRARHRGGDGQVSA